MKAIRVHEFGGPAVLKLEDVPDPKPGAGEAVVRVRAAGVNPVDAYIHSGTYARKPPLPYTPGQDGAGEVESVGAGVTGFSVGDRVYIAGVGNTVAGAGTYAERALCAASQLHRLPARIVKIVPAYESYEYFVLADGRIVIVDPDTLKIVLILT